MKVILRIPFLFFAIIESHGFLENLLVFKELFIDTSIINTKIVMLIMPVRMRRRFEHLNNFKRDWFQ